MSVVVLADPSSRPSLHSLERIRQFLLRGVPDWRRILHHWSRERLVAVSLYFLGASLQISADEGTGLVGLGGDCIYVLLPVQLSSKGDA